MKKIGKYTIVEELGRGGMGVVYKALDPVIGREVAIKLILERALENEEVRKRFYREARSAGRLSHDNITIVYDVSEADDKPYLVMEYLTGSSLRELIDTQASLSLVQKLDIAAQICQGLDFAHQHGIIHRDVKPDNVQVLDSGRVKIMDFGIARLGDDLGTLTQTNTSIGTPRYMSPEQIRGEKADARADIFSFGVLFYELLTGTNPFHGDHVTAVIYKVLHTEPEPIQLEQARLSASLQAVVSMCLEKDPADRYQETADLLADLRRLLVQHDATLLDASAQGGWTPMATTLREAHAEHRARRSARPAVIALAALILLGLIALGVFVLRPDRDAPMATLAEAAPDVPPALLAPDTLTAPPTITDPETSAPATDAPPYTPPELVQGEPAPSSQDAATRPEASSALEREATAARRDADRARRSAASRAQEPAAQATWSRAEAALATGASHLGREAFAEAAVAYRTAHNLYDAVSSLPTPTPAPDEVAAERPAAPDPARADAARTAMAAAKATVPAALHGHRLYQQAASHEQQAQTAYAAARYDEAAGLYGQAMARYAEAAAQPTPAAQARQAAQTLAGQLKQGFEAEDADALRTLAGFYGTWSDFFRVADDIEATVQPGAVEASAERATVDVQIRLAYRDNKNRPQTNAFIHTWTLQPRGGRWVLTDVAAR